MKKLNKKGFTLIEMLVVIAIIAILVAIIIPVVSAATDKAAAATDAANLRSFKAEIVSYYLSANEKVTPGVVTGWEEKVETPAMKAIGKDVDSCDKGEDDEFEVSYTGSEYEVTYQDKNVDWFAYYAENGEAPTTGSGS